MFKIFRAPIILTLALACAGPVFAQADPTLHEIFVAAETGHLDQAQQMMNKVLADHPQSAKAHFVAAELYARERDFPAARQQLGTAQTLEPGLPFAKVEAVQKLQRELAQGAAVRGTSGFAPAQAYSQARSIPWGLILIVVGAIAVLFAVMRRRAAPQVYTQYPGGVPVGAGPGGYGPGYGPGPGYGGGGGLGSGIAGGLASGLAVGAGVVAGEQLAHHFLDGNRAEGNVQPSGNDSPQNGDMGGQDFGVSDAGSWDDGSSGGDFGAGGGGGDDWT